MTRQKFGELELKHDLKFQQRAWIVQRVGWVVMLLIAAAALLGIFGGSGVLNQTALGDAASPLIFHYHRFGRVLKTTSLELEVSELPPDTNAVRVWISDDYLAHLEIKTITPEPEQVIAGEDRMIFVFAVAPNIATTRFTFVIEPHHIGSISGIIGQEDGLSYAFDQFIYP